jgi:hypothetical protein
MDKADFDAVAQRLIGEGVQIVEVAPPGWEGTVKGMKRHREIDNPWALAWWMRSKGYKSRRKKRKSESLERVQEATTTADVDTVPLPWLTPPLEGIEFSKEEQEETLEHISHMFPGLSKAELKKRIFGGGKKD